MARLTSTLIGIIVLQCLAIAAASAQERPALTPAPGDTLRTSMSVIDTLPPVRVDTAKRIPPLRSVGALPGAAGSASVFDANGITWKEYRTLTDVLPAAPGVFVRDMGSPGQDNQVSIDGAGHAGTAFLVDGIGHNDPVTGTFNFAFFPVEAIERLELVTGPRAFLYGANSTGGAVNVISKSFSNNKPFTRIRYSQGSYTYTQTDAMFSQNILPRFNLSFGLSYLGYGMHKSADLNAGRFPNSDNQAYSFRTKLRYNMSETVNLVFTHWYAQTQTGLFGGINLNTTTDPASVYDDNTAVVVNYDSYEKHSDHHASLAAVYRPLADTSLTATVSLFGSHLLREYRDEENRLALHTNSLLIADDFASTVVGAHATAEWDTHGNLVSAIAELSHTQYERSVYGAAFTRAARSLSLKDEFTIANTLTLAAFARLENGQERAAENAGGDVTLRLPGTLTLSAGASTSHRHLSIEEAYLERGAADSTIQKILGPALLLSTLSRSSLASDEVHTVTEASLRVRPSENFSAGITATRRVIDHWADRSLIKLYQDHSITVDGISLSLRLRHGDFFLDGDAAYTHHSEVLRNAASIRLYPEWRGQWSFFYRGLLANNNLDLKVGVKGMFVSAFDGELYRVVDGVVNPIVVRQIGNAGTVDFFVIAHIGDAYIHVLWENLTGSQYMLAPFYPMYNRSIRFGVSWEFQD